MKWLDFQIVNCFRFQQLDVHDARTCRHKIARFSFSYLDKSNENYEICFYLLKSVRILIFKIRNLAAKHHLNEV